MSGVFNELHAQAPSTTPVLEKPNESVVTPIADQSSNVAVVEVNDQFGAASALGGSVSFQRLRFGERPVGVQLFDSNSQRAEGYYNHRVSARNLLGVTYSFQRFTFEPNAGHTTVNAVLATYEIELHKHTRISFFAGPQYFISESPLGAGNAGSHKALQPAAGAIFAFNGEKAAIMTSVSRAASDGGGLLNNCVNLTAASATFRLRISQHWSGDFGGTYGYSNVIGSNSAGFSSLRDVSGRVVITRQIGMWNVGAGYSKILQSENAERDANTDMRHNSAWISIGYRLSRGLGRD